MSESQYQLAGRWENSYHSVMDLNVDPLGVITGSYFSTTGASGTYPVFGRCVPQEPTQDKGQALVLSIDWQALNAKPSDYNGTWHWVSTYCGQLNDQGELSLINSLVATVDYDNMAVGDYVDKLGFIRTGAAQPCSLDWQIPQKVIDNPINGSWRELGSGIQLKLKVVNSYGWVSGVIVFAEGSAQPFQGFTDTLSLAGVSYRQSLSLATMNPDGKPFSLSGYLDLQQAQLILTAWQANGTSIGNAYLQANAASLRLTTA
ncbi:avidin/streptavidin family protein [Celerinatantimonas sp. YJH-8]|uniref:avidin/streptavidin family protein n=1 Tax=Celerinatantimonas sp. YJH-8 TaxID=3228714 RepID=UPI0038C53DC0